MRIWDLPVDVLCRQHLLGEHRELHAIWSVLTNANKTGYRKHPETQRWVGRLGALYRRHEQQIQEMEARGYNHGSSLTPVKDKSWKLPPLTGKVDSVKDQIKNLRQKGCACRLEGITHEEPNILHHHYSRKF